MPHVTDLCSEISLLRDHVTSHDTHNDNILVKDLVREGGGCEEGRDAGEEGVNGM